MVNSAPPIAKLREEFTAHQASKIKTRFQPSLEASTAVSNLTRDLETKHQLEGLTADEKAILAETNALWEEISAFNNQIGSEKSSPAPAGEQVYSLKDSRFLPEPPAVKTEIPPITEALAAEIISGLNKQFEEKVMSHRTVVESGINLQDYISHIQTQKPRLPFAGEESHIDLQKLKAA